MLYLLGKALYSTHNEWISLLEMKDSQRYLIREKSSARVWY